MKKIYRIYGYFNIITLMWYVGRTSKSLGRRAQAGNGYRTCPKFWSAIQQYGWPNFECHILATTDDLEESYRLEQYWIEQKNSVENGYNTSTGGNGAWGVIASEERRKKISDAHKGMKYSDEVRQKVSDSHKGLKYPNRKRLSEEYKENLRNHPSYSKTVQQFTKDGKFVKEFPSMMEAQRETNTSVSGISACCKGKQNTAGGSIWKYA